MHATVLFFIKALKLLLFLYLVICILLYFFQERLIFFPEKLDRDKRFSFGQPFEEQWMETRDGTRLHGLLFTCAQPKGLIFYLHGNAGSVAGWSAVANTYTHLQYDVFLPDYRGYGKSEGKISSQEQLYADVQAAYNHMKKRYSEENMVVLGYSIGTGPASWLASQNHPKLLLLQAPYYSLIWLMRQLYPVLPTFLLKYRFETITYLRACRLPVVIFHGNRDEVIPYRSSLKLKEALKEKVNLVTLEGQGHNGMTDHPQYLQAMRKILE